jgi:phosphoesterase RecJ-like protein
MNKLTKLFKNDGKIAIGGHVHPDGDCVGSAVACAKYLMEVFPKKEILVFLETPAPEFIYLLEGVKFRTSCSEEIFDCFICLDCDSSRLGFSEVLFQNAKKTVNIDHHITNTGCADVNIIKPKASSTAEVLYEEFDNKKLNKEIAEALYIGIIHDSGVFQYSNTSPKTMEAGADLISYGFDFPTRIEDTFYKRTLLQSQIMAHVVLDAKVYLEGTFIIGVLSKKTMINLGAGSGDFEGIVNQLRNVEGVECAAFVYEKEDMEWKVSLRSTDKIDVSLICANYDGGGHKKAAGCSINGLIEEVIETLKEDIKKQMKAEEIFVG